MEKISKYDWALVGYKTDKEGEKLDDMVVDGMLKEAFLPDSQFKLFLYGAFVNKNGTLEEMENGLEMMEKLPNFNRSDYGIISEHTGGYLLFLPVKLENNENAEISGNTDSIQE